MPTPLPAPLVERHLRLPQPQRYIHGAIQGDGGGQLGAGVLEKHALDEIDFGMT
jgi:hypothetical protein